MRLLAFCILCLAAAAAHAQPVQITGGWIHAVPPFQRTATGYLTLQSEKNDKLTRITIDSGGTATLHKTQGTGDESGTADVESLPLPAGKTVTLSPSGIYVALVGRDAPLIPGSRVGMTLYFEHAPPETVVLNVLSRADSTP